MPAVSAKQKKFMDAVAHNKAFAKQVGVPQSVGRDFSKASKGLKFKEGGSNMKPKKMAYGGQAAKGLGTAAAASGRTMPTPANMKKGGNVKKMAYGGQAAAGLAKAAQMSGRTMPTPGRPEMTGLERAAAMSGRTMPTPGNDRVTTMPVRDTGLDRAAAMSGRTMPSRPMKKGGNVKKMAVGGPAGPAQMDPRAAAMMAAKRRARRPGMPPEAPVSAAPTMMPSPMKSGGRISSKGEHSVQKKSKRGAEMVKMASGGYVKAADGVAQRGKTKAHQVKMSGGGKAKRYC